MNRNASKKKKRRKKKKKKKETKEKSTITLCAGVHNGVVAPAGGGERDLRNVSL